MKDEILKYSEQIDQKVGVAIQSIFGKAYSVERLTGGEFNYVYKVETAERPVIVRVFRQRNSPDDGKLEWIEKELTEHQVPHAKTLSYSRDTTFFPFGFMTQEFLEGKSGFEAIMEGHISFEEFFNQEAVLLQKIHQISAQGFGPIKDGKGLFDSYFEAKVAKFEEMYRFLSSHEDLDSSLHERVGEVVKSLEQIDPGYFKSVLLHGDPPPGNTILTKDRGLVLIDWDNALVGSWIDEYTGLATRGAFMWQHSLGEEERNEIIQRAFRNHYKGVDFDDLTLKKVVKIIEVLNAYGGLVTHYYQHENIVLYETAKKRVARLLEQFS